MMDSTTTAPPLGHEDCAERVALRSIAPRGLATFIASDPTAPSPQNLTSLTAPPSVLMPFVFDGVDTDF